MVRVLRPLQNLPQTCGRYRIASVLGRGAMGVVYKAHDPLLDRDVAVKLIKTDLLDASERGEYLQRFMREAQAAARCAHRGIVGVYDFSENGGHPFIVMEFVEGPDLRQVMRTNGAQAPEQAVPIMLQVLDALTERCRLAHEFAEGALVRLRHAAPVGHGFGVPSPEEVSDAWDRTRTSLSGPFGCSCRG